MAEVISKLEIKLDTTALERLLETLGAVADAVESMSDAVAAISPVAEKPTPPPNQPNAR